MLLIGIVCACLCILSCLCLLAKQLPQLRSSVLAYGKLNETADVPTSTWAIQLGLWTVPKSWFSHFYMVGLVFSLYCWTEIILAMKYVRLGPMLWVLKRWDSPFGGHHTPWLTCLLGLALVTFHLTRRVYECYNIERPSPVARMHISHYLIGIGFYGAMVFGTWLEGAAALPIWDERDAYAFYNDDGRSKDISVYPVAAGIALFLYATKHQYQCHLHLASLRLKKKTEKNENIYKVPYGGWFDIWVAPHYVCDMLIYLSLCILYEGQNGIMICGFIWTVLNLSVTAMETKSWYIATFPHYPEQRSVLLPGIF